MNRFHSLPVTLTGTDPERKREDIRRYFHHSFDLFESLFDVLGDDDVFYRQSEPTRHPMIFYFGHTAVFFINKLLIAQVIDTRINADYEAMFAVGVDEMRWDDMASEHYRWPSVPTVRAYRQQVRELVDGLISTLPLTLPITQQSPWWIILMGIEHERIHIETSSVLHRQMPLEFVRADERFAVCTETGAAPPNAMVAIDGATVQLGKGVDHHLYGWDNEYGTHEEVVKPFKASRYLVSNGEYLPFVEAGGYQEIRYWCEEGQTFLQKRQATLPPFWLKDGAGGYRLRVMACEIPLPLDWPVEVNALEAAAFCRYLGEATGRSLRLPAEAEWYRMLQTTDVVTEHDWFDDTQANLNFRHVASSVPVTRFAQGALYDVVGNVWQWTATAIDGFEGFETHPAYDDFSTPTFDGKHNLMKGGSWASTGNEIMKHSRYAFRRHFYQHAGFRYVEGEAIADVSDNVYETDALVSQYCEFQYGPDYFEVRNFARTCAEYAIEFSSQTPQRSALDLGCATGRATFELARVFDRVVGIDFSARFIQVGVAMQTRGGIGYERVEEGMITSRHTQTLADLGLAETADRVEFWQGDACNLKPHLSGYDLILATNLIDRLYEPRLFLDTVHARLNEEGILILTSPYTWLSEYTDEAHWLGGYYDAQGQEVRTIDALRTVLATHFEQVQQIDVPFVIRETARKYQHTVAQMSIWRRR